MQNQLTDAQLLVAGKCKSSGLCPWGIGTTKADYLHAARAVIAAHEALQATQARAQAVQRQCIMCHGTGQHPMAQAIPAGVEPPAPRMVECQQCKPR